MFENVFARHSMYVQFICKKADNVDDGKNSKDTFNAGARQESIMEKRLAS